MDDMDSIERAGDLGEGGQALVRRWTLELERADRAEAQWRDSARRVLARFRDVGEGRRARFNVLFANTRTLAPALFSSVPKPDVRRRHRDADPVARQSAEVLARALGYAADSYDMDGELRAVIQDYLLTGRGVVRVRYDARFESVATRTPVYVSYGEEPNSRDDTERRGGKPMYFRRDTMEEVADPSFDDLGPFVAGGEHQEVATELAVCEHVHWDDFRVSPSRSWGEARWVAFRTLMTRDELVAQFGGEAGGAVPVDEVPDDSEEGNVREAEVDAMRRAVVWEIWDKDSRRVIFLAPGYRDAPLRVLDDPLGLAGFFPVPRPIYSVPATDSLVPYPEYLIYEDQARELDEVTRRIMVLTKALKLRGVYDAAQPEIAQLLSAEDNKMIPSENFMALIEKGGLDKAVQFAPVQTTAAVLSQLYANREQIKATIYEITGLADIMRGATRATETATAQSIKTRWGALRLEDRQREVQRLIRDVFRLKAEIIAEKFGADTLATMTGVAVDDDMLDLLQADGPRGYRIDVETDASLGADEAQDRQAVTELLGGITGFITGIAPLVETQANPAGVIPLESAKALLLAAVRRFRFGRDVEDALDAIGKQDPAAALEARDPRAAEAAAPDGRRSPPSAVEPPPVLPGAVA